MWTNFKFNSGYTGDVQRIILGVTLPDDYVEFMMKHNGGEGDIGESWLVLYPLEELQEINDEFQEDLPEGHIIIGSNGGGELIGVNCSGEYFIVPEIIEEEYLDVLGSCIDDLPKDINEFWNSKNNR